MSARRAALPAALSLFLLAPSAGAARVTFVATRLPPDTPSDATLTLAANAGGWDPARPGFAFTREGGGAPRLALDLPAGTLLQFKLTRGAWASVETRPDGGAHANRVLEVKGDARVDLRVERWADRPAPAPPRHTLTGEIETLCVETPELAGGRQPGGACREVLVWLPPGYHDGRARYPVLYLHDGRNVFDEATAFAGLEWRADEAATDLARRGQGVILVAIAAAEGGPGGGRLSEYGPWPMPSLGATGRGDDYADFIVRTLKPRIDARYRTRPERAATGVAGSSMGGLISLYMALRQPEVFGFVGALSPSLWFADARIFAWVQAQPPSRTPPRVYLDMGEQEGDDVAEARRGVEQVRAMARLLRRAGANVRLVVGPGTHSEEAWAQRFPKAVQFLLRPTVVSRSGAPAGLTAPLAPE